MEIHSQATCFPGWRGLWVHRRCQLDLGAVVRNKWGKRSLEGKYRRWAHAGKGGYNRYLLQSSDEIGELDSGERRERGRSGSRQPARRAQSAS